MVWGYKVPTPYSLTALSSLHSFFIIFLRYVEGTDVPAHSSRAALTKYLFYYDRFIQHDKSLGFEKDLQDTIQVRIQTKLLRKPINGLYHFERLVVINLSRLDKNGSINGLQSDKNDTI